MMAHSGWACTEMHRTSLETVKQMISPLSFQVVLGYENILNLEDGMDHKMVHPTTIPIPREPDMAYSSNIP